MDQSIAAIVVVYNKSCLDSSTCTCLSKIKKPLEHVIIWDNSTTDYQNKKIADERGWHFLGGTGNCGLSKAYNASIDYLKEQNFSGALCLFDDDTDLSEDYFFALEKALCDSEAKIFVPFIFSAGTLISPCKLSESFQRTLFSSKEEALLHRKNDISAINSCMAIKMQVFDDYKYDENIFLDGIDHHFMLDMRKKNYSVSVFDYTCEHGFSGNERPPFSAALKRFQIFAKDHRYIFKKKPLAYLKLVGKRALSLCMKYKKLDFFKYL